MPCDKNYPYCNNPLNWEWAAHQKEKREKGARSNGGGGGGDLPTSLEPGPLITRISSLFEEADLKRIGMMKLK